MKTLSNLEKVLFAVATGQAVQFEGRSGIDQEFCCFCGADTLSEEHEDGCEVLLAREELGVKWQEHLEDLEKEKVKEKLEKEKHFKWKATQTARKQHQIDVNERNRLAAEELGERIKCPMCKKKVREKNMQKHQSESLKCREKVTRKLSKEFD